MGNDGPVLDGREWRLSRSQRRPEIPEQHLRHNADALRTAHSKMPEDRSPIRVTLSAYSADDGVTT